MAERRIIPVYPPSPALASPPANGSRRTLQRVSASRIGREAGREGIGLRQLAGPRNDALGEQAGTTVVVDAEDLGRLIAGATELGVLRRRTDPLNLPHELTLEEAQSHSSQNDLLPGILEAIETEVERIHLLDAHTDGSLLLELYTRDGVGSMIAAEQFECLRTATEEDISGIMDLIRPLENAGTLIKRSREQLELEINNFHIITRDREVIACVALYETDDPHVGELACLAVNPQYRGGNRGDKLLRHIVQLAQTNGKNRLLVLTTQTTDWFRERGFEKGEIADLPSNKKSLYNYQRNSQVLFKQLS